MLRGHHEIIAWITVWFLKTEAMMCGSTSAASITTLIEVLIVAANSHKIYVWLRTELECEIVLARAELDVVWNVGINFCWHCVDFVDLFEKHLTFEIFCHLNKVDLIAVSYKQLHLRRAAHVCSQTDGVIISLMHCVVRNRLEIILHDLYRRNRAVRTADYEILRWYFTLIDFTIQTGIRYC